MLSLRSTHTNKPAEYIENLEIQRFRPNVVLTSADASDKLHGFEEDDWQHVEIFSAEAAKEGQEIPYGAEAEGKGKGIYVASRCARCQVPCTE